MDPIRCFSCNKIMKSPNETGMVFVRNMKKEDREQFFKNLIIQDFVVKECIFLQLIFKTNSSNMKMQEVL